jgi:hypothetical protein
VGAVLRVLENGINAAGARERREQGNKGGRRGKEEEHASHLMTNDFAERSQMRDEAQLFLERFEDFSITILEAGGRVSALNKAHG